MARCAWYFLLSCLLCILIIMKLLPELLCCFCIVILCCAEAACSHVVQVAKAACKDQENPSRALREFAMIANNNAEAAVHRLFRKYHLTIPIQPKFLNLGEGELAHFPYIPLTDWVTYLLDVGMAAETLCGTSEAEMPGLLTEYWLRYKAIHPQHAIFRMNFDMSQCVPMYSHIDEGRTYKKGGILILSCHGALGRGTRNYRLRIGRMVRKQTLKQTGMPLNYTGSSWATQFMIASLVRTAYAKKPEVLDKLLQTFAEDMACLAYYGVS